MKFSEQEIQELQTAKSLLENPGLAARMTNAIGVPVEKGIALLPDSWSDTLGEVTQAALLKASQAAILTMKDAPGEDSSNFLHKIGVVATGGVGGFFGIAGLAVELPISTTIILRSIADIARNEGESIASIDTQMACLEVFALGGRSEDDDATESGYFAVRSALAMSVADAAVSLAQKGLSKEAAPIFIKFVANVAERFGIQVTEKAAAQSIPALGAAGGALINALFIDHFQDTARGHFTVRRLERIHGDSHVREIYASIQKLA